MTKIETLKDAKRREKAALLAAKFFVPANLHPGIGVLTNAKGVTFYAYFDGSRHTVGTVEALTAGLKARAVRLGRTGTPTMIIPWSPEARRHE